MKRGFSLLIAIAFLVVIAIVGTLTMMTVATGTKETKNLYLYEQAQLYARSAVEYAILKIQEHDFEKNCLKKIDFKFEDLFEGTVHIKYIGHGSKISNCGSENFISDGKSESDNKISAVILYTRVYSTNDGEQVSYSRVTTQIP